MKPILTLTQELELLQTAKVLERASSAQLRELYIEAVRSYMLAHNMNRVYMLKDMGVSVTDSMITQFIESDESIMTAFKLKELENNE
jgi:hypothetical protein